MNGWNTLLGIIENTPVANVVEIPETGIGDLSDGHHTFNGLYYQRMNLFAALVKAYRDKAWKSRKHEDGEPCFGGGWFIVGIETPEGNYTYHYKDKYFDLFDCEELPVGKHWDGHTEEDVTRLLSLSSEIVRCGDCIHKPSGDEDEGHGLDLNFPDDVCPCRCDDRWYSHKPDDDWYCANGE